MLNINMFKQKGVSLYLAIVIMSILSVVALGLIVLSMSGIKMVKGLENSVMSFYAANTGIEHSLYNIRKQGSTEGVSGVLGEADYNVSIDVNGTTTVKSTGTYRETRRVIEVNYMVTIGCEDKDLDGYGVCPKCDIVNGCDYDGHDCCDLDALVNPGQTNYAWSINNCGDWDYDCNGFIWKHSRTCDKVGSCGSHDATGLCYGDMTVLDTFGEDEYYDCGESAMNSCCFNYYSAGCTSHSSYLPGRGTTVTKIYGLWGASPCTPPGWGQFCTCK